MRATAKISKSSTIEMLDSWPKDAFLVFDSNYGRRSLDQASYFPAYGFPRARCLSGGIEAGSPSRWMRRRRDTRLRGTRYGEPDIGRLRSAVMQATGCHV